MQNTHFGPKIKTALNMPKILTWDQKLKMQKGGKNDCTTTLEFLCEKNASKKQLILEK